MTGGAGYVGSHTAKVLAKRGYEVLTYDNLSTGRSELVKYGELVVADLADRDTLKCVIRDFRPDAVIHLAASIVAPESLKKPAEYYRNNVVNSLNLIESEPAEIFVFSSTAAVYSAPEDIRFLSEEDALLPINPYGWSKLMTERMLEDISRVIGMKYISLKYFNVAGADPELEVGPVYDEPTHLIPSILKVALGERGYLPIYGDDYPTPDGTCVRDYIHVMDIAQVHVLAVEYLRNGGKSTTLNCGYGRGFSVKEVVKVAEEVIGRKIPIRMERRREGDPPYLVADPTKAKTLLGWVPQFDDMHFIIKTAWEWEKQLKGITEDERRR